MKQHPLNVPVFKLYGEEMVWPTPDLLHIESIPVRSRLYHWEIKPHRHGDLFQLLYVQEGWAEIEIEGQRNRIDQASLQVVPPLCIHGFHFSEEVAGYVLTLARPLVAQLDSQLQALDAVACYPVGMDRAYLDSIFSTLHQEYRGDEPARDILLRSLVTLLMVWVNRQALRRQTANSRQDRGRAYLTDFMQRVEQHFRTHLSVEQYAHDIGISVAHLNSICRQLTGQSALQIIHQRLLLEAKRSLIYTTMTVNQLSDQLGFSEPAYFSRFFRRLTGMAPNAFRRQDDGHADQPDMIP